MTSAWHQSFMVFDAHLVFLTSKFFWHNTKWVPILINILRTYIKYQLQMALSSYWNLQSDTFAKYFRLKDSIGNRHTRDFFPKYRMMVQGDQISFYVRIEWHTNQTFSSCKKLTPKIPLLVACRNKILKTIFYTKNTTNLAMVKHKLFLEK